MTGSKKKIVSVLLAVVLSVSLAPALGNDQPAYGATVQEKLASRY